MNNKDIRRFLDEVMTNVNDIEKITLNYINSRDTVDNFNDAYIINQKAHKIKKIYETYIKTG